MTSKLSPIWTAAWWRATAERVLSTVLAVVLGTGVLDATAVLDVHQWANVAKIAFAAAGASLVKALVAALATGGASLGGGEVTGGKVAAEQTTDGGTVAGPAAPGIPEGTPVDVVPDPATVDVPQSSDTKADAAKHDPRP